MIHTHTDQVACFEVVCNLIRETESRANAQSCVLAREMHVRCRAIMGPGNYSLMNKLTVKLKCISNGKLNVEIFRIVEKKLIMPSIISKLQCGLRNDSSLITNHVNDFTEINNRLGYTIC